MDHIGPGRPVCDCYEADGLIVANTYCAINGHDPANKFDHITEAGQ